MVWGTVHLSRDAAALRKEIVAASGAKWQTRVQISAGRPVLAAVRAGLSLAKDVPDEAREALAAVRSASVGVYERIGSDDAWQNRSFIVEADKVMARRGWKRIVGVNEPGNTVLIYMPAGSETAEPSRVCLAVCSGSELVIVSARVDAGALANLATREIGRHRFAGL
jgi:hypothetical protein